MAHGITEFDNFSYNTTPGWHRIGEDRAGQSRKEWTEKTFPWHYVERPIYTLDADGNLVEEPDHKSIARSDRLKTLSIVSKLFKVYQPEPLMEFYDSLLDTNLWEMETAGSLQEGRKIFATARYKGDPIVLFGQDVIKPYLLAATGVGTDFATVFRFVSTRVVCANTLAMAMAEGTAWEVKVNHRSEVDTQVVKAKLGLIEGAVEEFGQTLETLSEVKISDAEAIRFLYSLLGDPRKPLEDQPKAFNRAVEALHNSPGADLRSAKGTLWGAVNAVTYYVDHLVGERSTGGRANSAMFGSGSALKSKALSEALKLAA